jgi:type III pantothenate kinase
MLLAVDIGNTQTHIGAFDGAELAHDWRLATDPRITSHELAATLSNLLGLDGLSFESLDAAIVSTVVPQLGRQYAELCERHVDGPFLKVGPSLRTGMPIKVDNPHELGADRLVNAVAGYAQAGGACISVDFGTSTNFDVVSGSGEYMGGAIGPGLEISLEALTARTAKLPRIDIASVGPAIGRNTLAAIQSGFAYGFAGLVDGINRRLAGELDEDPVRIATGGLAAMIAPHCETIDRVDPLLTLQGLRLVFQLNA